MMGRVAGLVAAVLAGAFPALGTAATDTPPIAGAVVNGDPYPRRPVAFPQGVRGIPDLTYASYYGYRPLKLDLYLPPSEVDAKGPRGVVVYVHGGGWRNGTTRANGAFQDWPGVLASLAAKGYVVAAVNYRLAGEAPSPAAVTDVKAAIRWLRANAATYNIDKGRFLLWGPSAGGQIAGVAAVSCGVQTLEPHETGPAPAPMENDCVQAAIGWFGSYEFASLERPDRTAGSIAAERAYLGCQGPCSPETQRAASAVTYIDRSDPPMLLIHGVDDRNVPVGQSILMAKALTEAGVKAELLTIPGVQHNFLGPTPEATRAANIQAIRKTFDFVDATIGDKSGRR